MLRLAGAVKGIYLFQHLSGEQLGDVFGVIQRYRIQKGQIMIRQRALGDTFFVIDSGIYEVRIDRQRLKAQDPATAISDTNLGRGGSGPASESEIKELGECVHVYEGHGAFGELALLHNKPRSASVVCMEEGFVWGLSRRAFRTVLMRSSPECLARALRRVKVRTSITIYYVAMGVQVSRGRRGERRETSVQSSLGP
jgi:CRP-like cAMP-binding protein